MSERAKQSCSECGYPTEAGHASACSKNVRSPEQSRERKGSIDSRFVFAALAALSGGLANFSGERLSKDLEGGEERSVPTVSAAERDQLLGQLNEVAKRLQELPVKEVVAEEAETGEPPIGLDDVDLSPEALVKFPEKDAPVRGSGSIRILHPDMANWLDLTQGKLQDVYEATVDDLVVDADPESIHVYSPSNESLDVVLTLQKHDWEGGGSSFILQNTEGYQVDSWPVGEMTPEKMQDRVRQVLQKEIIKNLKEQTN